MKNSSYFSLLIPTTSRASARIVTSKSQMTLACWARARIKIGLRRLMISLACRKLVFTSCRT